MEPLPPDIVRTLLRKPGVTPADIEEYERLLSARFARDPSEESVATRADDARLKALYRKLFVD